STWAICRRCWHISELESRRDTTSSWPNVKRVQARRRPPRTKPTRFYIESILAWADAHHERHGDWPDAYSGPVPESPWTTWRHIDRGLEDGFRRLRGGSSQARLLAVVAPQQIAQQTAADGDERERVRSGPLENAGFVQPGRQQTFADLELEN